MLFFFSSRRRHTRCSRDWSSDVCSSDLSSTLLMMNQRTRKTVVGGHKSGYFALCCETPLKVMVGNSGPWTPKTASFRRRHWPDSVRRGGFYRTVFPAHRLSGGTFAAWSLCPTPQPVPHQQN